MGMGRRTSQVLRNSSGLSPWYCASAPRAASAHRSNSDVRTNAMLTREYPGLINGSLASGLLFWPATQHGQKRAFCNHFIVRLRGTLVGRCRNTAAANRPPKPTNTPAGVIPPAVRRGLRSELRILRQYFAIAAGDPDYTVPKGSDSVSRFGE